MIKQSAIASHWETQYHQCIPYSEEKIELPRITFIYSIIMIQEINKLILLGENFHAATEKVKQQKNT